MFNAEEFTYDGVFSGKYGLKIASLNSSTTEETSYAGIDTLFDKPSKGRKFYYIGSKVTSPPTCEFAVLCKEPLQDFSLKEISVWLEKDGFKPLVVHQPDLNNYKYMCVFNITSLIYHCGRCIGLNLRATFDSHFMYGADTITNATIKEGETKEFSILNKSDKTPTAKYVNPKMEITFSNSTPSPSEVAVVLTNNTDDNQREFRLKVPDGTKKIIVDNQEKKIEMYSGANGEIVERGLYLDKFIGKNWLRLLSGKNQVSATIENASGDTTIKITCPQYVKIRY